jgi:hypothetical protein
VISSRQPTQHLYGKKTQFARIRWFPNLPRSLERKRHGDIRNRGINAVEAAVLGGKFVSLPAKESDHDSNDDGNHSITERFHPVRFHRQKNCHGHAVEFDLSLRLRFYSG